MNKVEAQQKVREIIIQKRKELGISGYQLAQMLDVQDSHVYKWEKGAMVPLSSTLLIIMDLNEESIDELNEKLRIRKAAKKERI